MRPRGAAPTPPRGTWVRPMGVPSTIFGLPVIEREDLHTPAIRLGPPMPPFLNIPKDKTNPTDAVQCDGCGGLGCRTCEDKGWLPAGHPKGRTCERRGCLNPIPPSQVAVYCSNVCARLDA